MNPITVLRSSARVAARILAVAACMLATGALLDLPAIGAHAAWAKDGADDGADDRADDGSSHDDGGDDHGGGGHGADDDGDQSRDASESGPSGSDCGDSSVSADLNYADGFHEHVSDCTYVLTDQHGRVVITRSATQHDLERLQQLIR